MVNVLRARLQNRSRTIRFPDDAIALPERFRGRPKIDPSMCADGCRECVDACPTQAISLAPGSAVPRQVRPAGARPAVDGPTRADLRAGEASTGAARQTRVNLDLGRCIFCTECVSACPEKAITYTTEFRMATSRREDLVLTGEEQQLAGVLGEKMRRLFGRSLKLRQVSAGGCNGCEVEANAMGNIVFDAFRFGIQFVASPRHADGLLVTGAVSKNMELALTKTYDALPPPRLVIACGSCAISGGPFRDHPEVLNGCTGTVPVDLYIPGSPPHPLTILDGLLRLLGRIEDGRRPV